MKLCKKYKIIKSINCFYIIKETKDRLSSWCKDCYKLWRQIYYEKNKQKELVINTKWRERNPKYQKEWRKKNPEKVKQYSKNFAEKYPNKVIEKLKKLNKWNKENPDHVRERNRKWRDKNRMYIRKRQNTYRREYRRKRYREDINYRISELLRCRLHIALTDKTKKRKTLEYAGCSIEELKQYLEKQFQPGMSWDKYGLWRIDHIIPLSSFDLSKKEQIKKSCHYTNLQLLWAKDNLKKGNKNES